MKYSKSNTPLVCMQTNSLCYKGTSKMQVVGVLFHSTGANNPSIKRYVQPTKGSSEEANMLKVLGVNTAKNDWNHIFRNAGLNAWIGKLANGEVATVQTMPWNYKPWGCGSGRKGSCNNGWIQFEICEDNLKDKAYFDKVYKEAVELTAYLCQLYNLDPKGVVKRSGVSIPVLTCHADANKLGFASNHGDINHWFSKYGKSMATVREDVAKLLKSGVSDNKTSTNKTSSSSSGELYRVRKLWSDTASQIGAFKSLDSAKKACKFGYTVYDSKGTPVYTPRKTVEQVAAEVIAGKWGVGADRKKRLTEAGYNYSEVQKAVNKLM